MGLHETDVVANRYASLFDPVRSPLIAPCYMFRSFDVAWTKLRSVLDEIGQRKCDFAKQTLDIGEELNNVVKDTERSRKQINESALKLRKQVSDAEVQLEKVFFLSIDISFVCVCVYLE